MPNLIKKLTKMEPIIGKYLGEPSAHEAEMSSQPPNIVVAYSFKMVGEETLLMHRTIGINAIVFRLNQNLNYISS